MSDIKQPVGLSPDDLKQLIKALKEPDAETQAKMEIDKERKAIAKTAMVAELKQYEESIKRRQTMCSHTKPDGSRSWSGQLHSDGKVHPICVICGKLDTPYKPAPEFVMGG